MGGYSVGEAGGLCGNITAMRSANMKRVPTPTPPLPLTDRARSNPTVDILQKIKPNWQDALFGGMILASLAAAIYMFGRH